MKLQVEIVFGKNTKRMQAFRTVGKLIDDDVGGALLGMQARITEARSQQTKKHDAHSTNEASHRHTPEQEREADALGLKLLANSPYKDKLGQAGLFLKALAKYGRRVPSLVRSNLGESLVTDNRISFMNSVAENAPPLELDNPQQIVALPLGSRVKLEPWAGQLKFVKASPPHIYSAKDGSAGGKKSKKRTN